MSFWKKTMDYLGLGPDDAYDDYDDQVEPEPPRAQLAVVGRRRDRGAVVLERHELAGRVGRDGDPRRPGAPELPVARLRVAGPPAPARRSATTPAPSPRSQPSAGARRA